MRLPALLTLACYPLPARIAGWPSEISCWKKVCELDLEVRKETARPSSLDSCHTLLLEGQPACADKHFAGLAGPPAAGG